MRQKLATQCLGCVFLLDHFFLLQKHVPLVHGSTIRDSAWSNHSLLLLMLNSRSTQRPGFNWRLNASILSNPTHASEIEKNIQEYFLLNDVNNISPSSLWAEHKAAIRGKLIQISSRLRKAHKLDRQTREGISFLKQNT